MNREFVMLAQTYNPVKHGIGGWFVSEKLDGCRCLWDGGLTRGMLASEVPFANTEKDFRLVTPPVATGLWSRYGKVIRAPSWWLDKLPLGYCLDGELYVGPGQFQETMSIIKQHNPDSRWEQVKFAVFDMPGVERLFMDGKINNPQFKLEVSSQKVREAFSQKLDWAQGTRRFIEALDTLTDILGTESNVFLHWQERLPISTQAAEDRISELMDVVINKGGEGLILRKPESIWTPKRTWDLLKVKPMADSEGTVAGYVWGKGKYENLMGAMVVSWEGKQFELSGFTDAERILLDATTDKRASGTPGTKVDCTKTYSSCFPLGSIITFKFRELSDGGLPKEARYFRKS